MFFRAVWGAREMATKPTRESVLIAGASEGIGAATAKRLSRAGYKVFGTATLAPAAEPAGYRMLAMDLSDPASIAAAIDSVITQAGRIDAFINAIGSRPSGAVEEIDPADLVALFEANVLGPLRACQAVIPVMRRQKSGRIIHLSSLAARVGVPQQGAYSATRAALSRLSDSMSLELAPFGIRVTTIERDDTRTPSLSSPEWVQRAPSSAAYRSQGRDAFLRAADKVAQRVERVLRARNPRIRYEAPRGRDSLFLWMQHLLPDRAPARRTSQAYEAKASKADAR